MNERARSETTPPQGWSEAELNGAFMSLNLIEARMHEFDDERIDAILVGLDTSHMVLGGMTLSAILLGLLMDVGGMDSDEALMHARSAVADLSQISASEDS